ncbi:MAG: Glycerophosphoryl diester phosphodiesterase, partial [uncultured Solirubrobacteraceae bacterium]
APIDPPHPRPPRRPRPAVRRPGEPVARAPRPEHRPSGRGDRSAVEHDVRAEDRAGEGLRRARDRRARDLRRRARRHPRRHRRPHDERQGPGRRDDAHRDPAARRGALVRAGLWHVSRPAGLRLRLPRPRDGRPQAAEGSEEEAPVQRLGLHGSDATRGPRDVPRRAHQHRDQGDRSGDGAVRARAGRAAGRVRPRRRHDRRLVHRQRDRGVQALRARHQHRGRHGPGRPVLGERAGTAPGRAEPAPPGAAGPDHAQRPDDRHARVRQARPRERPGRPRLDDQQAFGDGVAARHRRRRRHDRPAGAARAGARRAPL